MTDTDRFSQVYDRAVDMMVNPLMALPTSLDEPPVFFHLGQSQGADTSLIDEMLAAMARVGQVGIARARRRKRHARYNRGKQSVRPRMRCGR